MVELDSVSGDADLVQSVSLGVSDLAASLSQYSIRHIMTVEKPDRALPKSCVFTVTRVLARDTGDDCRVAV